MRDPYDYIEYEDVKGGICILIRYVGNHVDGVRYYLKDKIHGIGIKEFFFKGKENGKDGEYYSLNDETIKDVIKVST